MQVGKTFADSIAVLVFITWFSCHRSTRRHARCTSWSGRVSAWRIPRSAIRRALRPAKMRSRSDLSSWTAWSRNGPRGEAHDVTDRSFVVRRVLRINDELPGEKPSAPTSTGYGSGARGCWWIALLATSLRSSCRITIPGVSQVSWFRDYAAYCGVTASGKSLYAVVAQLAARKPVLAKKLAAFDLCQPNGAGLRHGRVAARTAARHFPSGREGCRQLRHRSGFGGAGGRLGRRSRNGPYQPRQINRIECNVDLRPCAPASVAPS